MVKKMLVSYQTSLNYQLPNFHLSSEASKESGGKAKFRENSATVVGVSSSNLVRYVFTIVALYILFFIAEQ